MQSGKPRETSQNFIDVPQGLSPHHRGQESLLSGYLSTRVPCQAEETFLILAAASCRFAIDDANEKRTKLLPEGPNAAPGMAATPASSSRTRQIASPLAPVPRMSTQA